MKLNQPSKLSLVLLSFACLLTPAIAHSQRSKPGLTPVNLRCEYTLNPIGVDVAKPRLCWTFEATERSQLQTAFQLQVASSEAKIKANQGDLWDTGKVSSDQSFHVACAGKPLAARQRAWWQVKVWDRAGRESTYSAPAFFEMGLLQPSDWRAKWITIRPDSDHDRSPLAKAKWIYPANQPLVEAGQKLQFLRTLTIPAGVKVTRADLHYAADTRPGERGTVLFVNHELDPSLWRSARSLRNPSIFHPFICNVR